MRPGDSSASPFFGGQSESVGDASRLHLHWICPRNIMLDPRDHSNPLHGVGALGRNGVVHDEVTDSALERAEEKSLLPADAHLAQESMMREERPELENSDGHHTLCHDQGDQTG